jgi:hypothetical protein
VAETYLQHAEPEQPAIDIEVGLREVGFLVEEIRTANDLELELISSPDDNGLQFRYEAVLASIRERLENFPDPEDLNTIVLNCDGDIFLEVLMSNVRNTLISFQTWLKNVKNFSKSLLIKEINDEKAKTVPNWDNIFVAEKNLNELVDRELSEKISQIKLYECLHDEKPSPLFLQLIRKSADDHLESICDDGGNVFDSQTDRIAHIVDSYEKIFKIPKEEKDFNFENCIENFLGPDICNHPVVTNSKITPDENQILESPLQLKELDDALKNANKKSAPGMDGFSMKLIELCW